MANLLNIDPYPIDIEEFPEDVVRIDITDRVKGYNPAQTTIPGKANEQAISLNFRDNHLLRRVRALEAIFAGLDTDTLAQLDLTLLAREQMSQTVTIPAGATTQNINLALGAIITVQCGNTQACTLTFSNQLKGLSGLIIFQGGAGQDHEIILPPTWAVAEISRTLTIRNGKANTLPFEYVRLAANTPVVVAELVYSSSLSPNLLMPS